MTSVAPRSSSAIIAQARTILASEAQSLLDAMPNIDESFVNTVQLLAATKGRVIMTGMGKPGYIAHKIAATLASTGTTSFYLHPAEAAHGDLGMVTAADTIVMLSNSGETAELLVLLPVLKKIGLPIVALCGNAASTLVAHSDVFISTRVEQECCPLNLAPTNSTTLALALGDALAVNLMQIRQFKKNDFAFNHPGGALGKRLLTSVKDIMKSGKACCAVPSSASILDALFTMTSSKSGAVSVINERRELTGIVTDGDIRRYVMYNNLYLTNPVTEVMVHSPEWVDENELVEVAIRKMTQKKPSPITVLPVLDRERKITGILTISDLMNSGFL